MPTMRVTREVEVTTETVKQHLTAFANASGSKPFPYPKGAWLKLKEPFEKGIQALPGMPVLVMSVTDGFPMAWVAVCKQTGPALAVVTADQVAGIAVD